MKFKKGKRFNVQMSPTVEGGEGGKYPFPIVIELNIYVKSLKNRFFHSSSGKNMIWLVTSLWEVCIKLLMSF